MPMLWKVIRISSCLRWTLADWGHAELKTEQNGVWFNDSDFPLSKSVTCLTVIHRYQSGVREAQPWVWCSHESLVFLSGRNDCKLLSLSQRRLNLTFFPDAAYLHKAVGVTPHFPCGYPKKESRSYITWISASGSFAFSLSCERKSSFSWFVSVWGVHITGSDNFRSCAFVSMVTGREGEGFLGVCVCVCVCDEGAVGRQWAHTHRHIH